MTEMPASLGVLIKAIAFAADKHRNQRRKDVDGSPYINHPISLADVLVNEGNVTDVTVLCAAVTDRTKGLKKRPRMRFTMQTGRRTPPRQINSHRQ